MDREARARARAKASWYHSLIYTASHDAQGRWRGVHFRDRARGAKIGPSGGGGKEGGRGVSESRCRGSAMEALWALGALEP